MKIGILTYHRAINYGAILQAYALQTFLIRQGFDVKIIDYWPEYHSCVYDLWNYKLFKSYGFLSKMRYSIHAILRLFRYRKKKRGFNSFINERLDLTNDSCFDAIVYGSDQIWRKQPYLNKESDYNLIYFGGEGLISNKKIAYAASMGRINKQKHDIEFFRNHLDDFSAISVRENDLLDFITKDVGVLATQVLDPTLLVDRNVWVALLEKSKYRKSKGRYLLFYKLHNISDADKAAERVAKELSLDIKIVNGAPLPFHYSSKYCESAAMYEFLDLMANAEFVVTTSFHGLAMAIQFNKQFYAFTIPRTKNRLLSLLSALGIAERLNAQEISTNNPINYELVNNKLQKERKLSSDWLLNKLNN